MILNDNLLESSISIKYLRDWLNEQEKGGAKFIRLRINDSCEDEQDDILDMLANGDCELDNIQLEAV